MSQTFYCIQPPSYHHIINLIHLRHSIDRISAYSRKREIFSVILTIYRDYSLGHYCMNYINHYRTNCHCTKIDRLMLKPDTRIGVDLPTFQIPMNQSKTWRWITKTDLEISNFFTFFPSIFILFFCNSFLFWSTPNSQFYSRETECIKTMLHTKDLN